MSKQKDELISASELARRIKVDPSYIAKRKTTLKAAKCTFGKKFYYIKSCDFLGKDPKDPHKSRQSNLQTAINSEKKSKKTNPTKPNQKKPKFTPPAQSTNTEPPEDSDKDAKSLLKDILKAVNGGDSSVNKLNLDTLRQKAGVLREYFTAKNEEIKNRKLEDNLFERDEVIKILSFAMNMIRNSLINLPNNYAVSLEGLSQKEIKDYVTDDTNKILEDLQNIGNQFE